MLTDIKLSLLRGVDADEIYKSLTDEDKARLIKWGEGFEKNDLKELCEILVDIQNGKTEGISDEIIRSSFLVCHNEYPKFDKKDRGAFIVIEGLDGSGKGTQFARCQTLLEQYGRLYTTAEPTASAVGGMLRDVLGGITKKNAYEQAALFLADRISHCTNEANGIEKYLSSGINVLCDRYYYSTFAYQGTSCDMNWLINAHYGCEGIIKPDLCIFLDVSPATCFSRVSKDRLHIEIFEQAQTLQKVRDKFALAFEKINDKENIVIINADRTIEEVAADIKEVVTRFMEGKN